MHQGGGDDPEAVLPEDFNKKRVAVDLSECRDATSPFVSHKKHKSEIEYVLPELKVCPEVSEISCRKDNKRKAFDAACESNFEVIIDCQWESDHSERTLKSLAQQIMFCYGMNRRSHNPCRIHVTGAGPRLISQFSKVDYKNWVGVDVHESDYTSLPPNRELVYLTADAQEELETLSPSCTYIIGGIVDRNRLKGVTFQKARAQGIRTAKLPLKRYCTIQSSPVLTVNHVFQILLSFRECGSWSDSFNAVLPQRKTVTVRPCPETKNAVESESSVVISTVAKEKSDIEKVG